MTNGSLMKVESIAECSFCNTFDLHYAIISLKNGFTLIFGLFESGHFTCGLLYIALLVNRSMLITLVYFSSNIGCSLTASQ